METKEQRIARMLEELRLKNIEDSKKTLTDSITTQIDEILQSSMKRRDKRSALYRVRRNAETAAQQSCDSFNRQYALFGVQVTLTPADLIPDIDFSSLLTNSVTVQETPIDLVTSDLDSSPAADTDAPLPSTSTLQPDSELANVSNVDHFVPIALQPLVPITEYCYSEMTTNFTRKEKKSFSYRTYLEITVQQTLAFIKRYGYGVNSENEFEDLSTCNHRLVVKFITSIRPCLSGCNRFIGILIRSDHPAYTFSGTRTEGILNALNSWNSNAAQMHGSRLCYLNTINKLSSGEKRHLFQKIPYTEDWSGLSSGGSSMLVHLLMWLRRSVPRSYEDNTGENIEYYHGYFYDPEYKTSYLTLSNEQIQEKLKKIARINNRSSASTYIPP